MMEMIMSMPLVWKHTCRFVFKTWQSETQGQFIFACIVCSLLGFAMIILPTIRRKILQKLSNQNTGYVLAGSQQDLQQIPKSKFNWKQHLASLFLYILYGLLHLLVMLLVMTVNGYVILSIMVGLTIGYSIVSPYCDRNDRKIQCCQKDGKIQSVLTNQPQN